MDVLITFIFLGIIAIGLPRLKYKLLDGDKPILTPVLKNILFYIVGLLFSIGLFYLIKNQNDNAIVLWIVWNVGMGLLFSLDIASQLKKFLAHLHETPWIELFCSMLINIIYLAIFTMLLKVVTSNDYMEILNIPGDLILVPVGAFFFFSFVALMRLVAITIIQDIITTMTLFIKFIKKGDNE